MGIILCGKLLYYCNYFVCVERIDIVEWFIEKWWKINVKYCVNIFVMYVMDNLFINIMYCFI